MAHTSRTLISMMLCTAAFAVTASASAQSQTCADGGALWSAAVSNALVSIEATAPDRDVAAISSTVDEIRAEAVRRALGTPVEDVQWCVDSNDPRCSPDPAGAPSSHLAHAGDAAQNVRAHRLAVAPMRRVRWPLERARCEAHGVRAALERPPRF